MIEKILKRLYKSYIKRRYHIKSAADLLASEFLEDYKKYPFFLTLKIHSYGFSVTNWLLLGLNDSNYRNYVSDIQYYGLHPLNGRFTAWIDDKLTLKYILAGTELNNYMPKYYFQIDSLGNILPLMDYCNSKSRCNTQDILTLLRDKKVLALKLVAGSLGEGFYKLECKNDKYFVNGICMDEDRVTKEIESLREYLVMEFLRPHQDLARICSKTVNTIRYLLGRIDGNLVPLMQFIRFGTQASSFVDNYNAGGVLCYINDVGEFENGNIIDVINLKNKEIEYHPDNQERLLGKIPKWKEVGKICDLFNKNFPQLDYLGIDVVITDKDEIKILEINSLTSLDRFVIGGNVTNDNLCKFFCNRLGLNK